MKDLIKRIFHTNPFTTLGGLLALVGVVLLKQHDITSTDFLAILGIAATVIGLASKDGIRADVPVAREDVPTGNGPALGSSPVPALLLLLGLATVTACTSSHPLPPVTDSVNIALQAAPVVPGLPMAQVLDTPVSAAPVPPYLAQPPADLTKRQLRQFRRAQRRALVEAARTVPRSLGKGSAYAAPGGTAVATKKPDAPVAAGEDNEAIDNTKTGQHANGGISLGGHDAGPATGAIAPPKLNFIEQIAHDVGSAIPWILGLVAAAAISYAVLSLRASHIT